MRTIAVINQKGGVGKTTTVANLGAGIASHGRATCLIDLDPQAHLTLHLGIEPGKPRTSVYDVMTSGAPVPATTMLVAPNLWVLPSVIDLAAAEMELVTTVGRERILHDRLAEQPLPYEFVLIDCPPSLGLLTLNALAAADDMLIPLQPHFLALQGLGKLLQTASLVQRRINPRLKVSGVILCMYETNTRLAAEVLADLQTFFESARDGENAWSGTRIFQSPIRRNIKLAESPSYGRTIYDYEPHCRGAEDYRALTEEFLAWADGRPWQPGLASASTAKAAVEVDDEREAAAPADVQETGPQPAPTTTPPPARQAVAVPPPYPPAAEPPQAAPAEGQPLQTQPAEAQPTDTHAPQTQSAETHPPAAPHDAEPPQQAPPAQTDEPPAQEAAQCEPPEPPQPHSTEAHPPQQQSTEAGTYAPAEPAGALEEPPAP